MSNKIFVGFVKVKEVQGQNGAWKYTQISFKPEHLELMGNYMNEKGYVNLKLNRSQKGKEYLEIDTYGLNTNPVPQQPQQPAAFEPPPMPDLNNIDDSDVPF